MTLKNKIMKLQTYKMYEDEDTVYVERDDVLKALELQLRDCKTCKHSDNEKCAYTEECHECMWESKYEQIAGEAYENGYLAGQKNMAERYGQPCEDAISREAVLALAEKGVLVSNGNYQAVCKAINDLPSVMPKGESESDG